MNGHLVTTKQLGFESFDLKQPIDVQFDDGMFNSSRASKSIANFESATLENEN